MGGTCVVELEMWSGGELTSNWGDSPVRQGLYTTLHCHFVRQLNRGQWPLSLCSHPWKWGQWLLPLSLCSHWPHFHGWLHKNNGHCPLFNCLTKWQWRVVYKPCLTGESPQLLVVSQAGNISLSRAYAPEGLGNVTPTGDSPVQFS